MQKAGWLTAPRAGLIMRFLMGVPVWAREHSLGHRQLDIRLLAQCGREAKLRKALRLDTK